MILKINGTGAISRFHGGRRCVVWQVKIFVDHNSVVLDRHLWVFRDFSLFVVACGSEIDVIGLPTERGQAHVDVRGFNRIDPAALVVLAFQAE